MIAEVTAGVLLALVIARVLSVILRRLWEPVAVGIVATYPKEKHLPTWFFVLWEILANEKADA